MVVFRNLLCGYKNKTLKQNAKTTTMQGDEMQHAQGISGESNKDNDSIGHTGFSRALKHYDDGHFIEPSLALQSHWTMSSIPMTSNTPLSQYSELIPGITLSLRNFQPHGSSTGTHPTVS